MSTKKGDISKALARNLTGIEAARLILQDSVEVDHGRPGFLSDKEIQRIKSNLSSSEAAVYNSWVEAYRAIDYTLRDARISSQDVIIRILKVIPVIRAYFEDSRQAQLRRFLPFIVTQKQYEDFKASQREHKLRELRTLYFVIDERLQERSPEAFQAWENTQEVSSGAFFIESRPEVWRATLEDVIKLIEAGNLRSALLKPKEIEKLAELEERKEEARQAWLALVDQGDKGEEADQASKELGPLDKEGEQIRRRMYEKGLASWSKEEAGRIVARLRHAQTGPLSEEELEELEAVLDNTYCSGEDLYNSGLPEHVKDVDTFWPWGLEGDEGEQALMSGYAIIQEPSASSLDKRGYYKAEPLSGYSSISGLERLYAEEGSDLKTFLQTMHRWIRAELRDILAMQSTLETVSEVIGVNFIEDMQVWMGEVLEIVRQYNSLLQAGKTAYSSGPLPKDLKLPPLKVDDLKPSKQHLKYLEERLAMSLGQDWTHVWAEEVDKLTAQIVEEEGLEVIGRAGGGRYWLRFKGEGEGRGKGEGAESD